MRSTPVYHQLFLSRFVGINMLIIAYFYYAMMDTATAFKGIAIWNTVGVFFGPIYGLLYLDAIMTPEGMAGMSATLSSLLPPDSRVRSPDCHGAFQFR
jgi:hypothetical protein